MRQVDDQVLVSGVHLGATCEAHRSTRGPTPLEVVQKNPKARAPNGWPDLETLVRQHFRCKTCLSGSNDEGHVRCASAKLRPAHAMSRVLPMRWVSCSGADPLQIHRFHCTSTARPWQRFSPGPRIAAPARYPAIRGVSKIASSGSTCALRTNFKLWMAPATELVRTRERSCRAPVITSCR